MIFSCDSNLFGVLLLFELRNGGVTSDSEQCMFPSRRDLVLRWLLFIYLHYIQFDVI